MLRNHNKNANSKDSAQFHITIWVCRYLLNLVPYLVLISDEQLIYDITGPITIPPFNKFHLFYTIAQIQFLKTFFHVAVYILVKFKDINKNLKKSLVSKLLPKYAFYLLFKLILIIFSENHRLKYYLHVFFIELFLLILVIGIDLANNRKVAMTCQLVFLDSLSRVALFYQITRTFNPNFGLYFFGFNLLILILSQLKGSKREALFVKHDIYRIMIVTFFYQLCLALVQLSSSFKPFLIWTATAYFFLMSIKSFTDNLDKKAFLYLLIVIVVTVAVQILWVYEGIPEQNHQTLTEIQQLNL